jgi:hypothetical protein
MRPLTIAALATTLLTLTGAARAATQTFSYTGAAQSFGVPPAGVTSITATAKPGRLSA